MEEKTRDEVLGYMSKDGKMKCMTCDREEAHNGIDDAYGEPWTKITQLTALKDDKELFQCDTCGNVFADNATSDELDLPFFTGDRARMRRLMSDIRLSEKALLEMSISITAKKVEPALLAEVDDMTAMLNYHETLLKEMKKLVIDNSEPFETRAVLKFWPGALNKEEFIEQLHDGEYYILKDLKLELVTFAQDQFFEDDDVIDSFSIDGGGDTGRLREYCSKFHPDVDFDTKFETHKSGVFSRYQEAFGFDYVEWVQEQIYSELCAALKDRGYRLPF